MNQKRDFGESTVFKDMTKKGMLLSFIASREYSLAKDRYTATLYDDFLATSIAVRDRLVERWISTQQRYHNENCKRVYYFSLEFLIGRLLGNNLMNLGLWKETEAALKEVGLDLGQVRDCESDAGLGNAGLGRLAACYLDSMATLGIPAHGYGIRYEYGIFHQKIINGAQVEFPDEWLSKGNPWEFQRPEYAVKVHFYGRAYLDKDENGVLRAHWAD
ncbi:MAG: glycogen/starch/alpha-glucan phosphorylase, partial [Candidatus Omnitrophota bacterium]